MLLRLDADRGEVRARGDLAHSAEVTGPAPEAYWRAALAACGHVLAHGAQPHLVQLGCTPDVLVLWDVETLGAPRAALVGDAGTLRTELRSLARTEPHLWSLLQEDRYAVGDLAAYLVARMTRGTYHVLGRERAHAMGLLDAGTGIPREALGDLVDAGTVVAQTEGRSFLGLGVPIVLAPADGGLTPGA